MTPAARTDAAIGLLAAISSDPTTPADRVAAAWFRRRRYAGSKDRAWVLSLVFSTLRRRGELDWALAVQDPSPRQRTLAALARIEKLDANAINARFSQERYGPGLLSPDEQAITLSLTTPVDSGSPPDWARANIPPELAVPLRESLGSDWVAELAALAEEAPVDLRVNALKGDRETARAALAKEGVQTYPTPLSPLGLRVRGRANVTGCTAFQDGLIEVQDEGSQLTALVVCSEPGQTVIDGCAGSGGKSLALAAAMQNEGYIAAYDSKPRRLDQARRRCVRAGITMIEFAESRGALPDAADRVLLDVPCSGSGIWRRNPAAKWSTTRDSVTEYAVVQKEILKTFAPYVKAGGRLVYVTCSLFAEENERQVEGFLSACPEFRVLPVNKIWSKTIGGGAPGSGLYLRLTPQSSGTDGFFAAVLERVE